MNCVLFTAEFETDSFTLLVDFLVSIIVRTVTHVKGGWVRSVAFIFLVLMA